ncbi:lytic transglycosylase domain-containing protein [Brucella anthropi]|uniref:lytic transglycosylase domain-containing protein n=1 Tax=Brucella anthropi TaxID=529 RepID=UPI00244C49BA|nr:transglycosylase SLT domain-containing protein [Brucella anthropi]MDG9789207.1 transglycosylase SLT domain-containing protein [Brucella anthropi]MDH0579086.1 transglycosylase SLT domain-containing protein [Brucella anthropi]MDH0815607.1 transglycosylase SLT domain-containing protein [Brucella anthropi]MDH2082453.1 transglycosylase SLT domain-containing protein [Brucella anthropi]
MKIKFVVVCALVGAMSSFGLNPALSAPSTEPTNLAALLKARQQNKTAEAEKPTKAPKKASVVSRRAAPTAKNSTGKGSAAKRSQSKDTTARNAKSGGAYSSIINRYASTYGVHSALAHAVVRHESNFQPNVRGKAGEIGLMQIKLSTARGLGYTGSAKGLYEPSTNIQFGMKYLAQAQKLGGGSTCGTILKYNAGHGAKRMNPTSAKYCSSVKAYMRAL